MLPTLVFGAAVSVANPSLWRHCQCCQLQPLVLLSVLLTTAFGAAVSVANCSKEQPLLLSYQCSQLQLDKQLLLLPNQCCQMADGWCHKLSRSGFEDYIIENGMSLKGLTFRELHKKTMSCLNATSPERWIIRLEKLPPKILSELVQDIETYFCDHYLEELTGGRTLPNTYLEKYFFMIKELISTGGHPCRWSLEEHYMENDIEVTSRHCHTCIFPLSLESFLFQEQQYEDHQIQETLQMNNEQ